MAEPQEAAAAPDAAPADFLSPFSANTAPAARAQHGNLEKESDRLNVAVKAFRILLERANKTKDKSSEPDSFQYTLWCMVMLVLVVTVVGVTLLHIAAQRQRDRFTSTTEDIPSPDYNISRKNIDDALQDRHGTPEDEVSEMEEEVTPLPSGAHSTDEGDAILNRRNRDVSGQPASFQYTLWCMVLLVVFVTAIGVVLLSSVAQRQRDTFTSTTESPPAGVCDRFLK
ncbi:hypothetical protein HPB52_004894 [Rhipicephalus sanguineus]|uniref:Transmembrane protein n=1 Tax=Rhipicephalus sanguineus TaxID=34632 RepID=A0A9D4PGZ7_RHISA|nr:hypothetical protein HPB52_004894 [Rhipicephalus sanguineus]